MGIYPWKLYKFSFIYKQEYAYLKGNAQFAERVTFDFKQNH